MKIPANRKYMTVLLYKAVDRILARLHWAATTVPLLSDLKIARTLNDRQ